MKLFNYIIILLFLFPGLLYGKTIIGKPKIIDGDTIHIRENKIRLHGIDAPETKQTCKLGSQKWFCGKESTMKLKRKINDYEVKCLITDIDSYNRYVAICSVNNININEWMVKNGWAIAYRYYSKDYVNEERHARTNKLGIWKSKFLEPYQFRNQNKN